MYLWTLGRQITKMLMKFITERHLYDIPRLSKAGGIQTPPSFSLSLSMLKDLIDRVYAHVFYGTWPLNHADKIMSKDYNILSPHRNWRTLKSRYFW